MLQLLVVIVLLSAGSTVVWAQTPASTYGQLQSGLEAAQKGAIRPGDGALSCEALETELVAVAKEPVFQSHVAKWGAAAQEKMAAMNAAAPSVAAQSALALFSSIVPGGAWAGQAAAAAQAQGQQAQAAANMQQAMQQAQEMMAIMPQLMRGQRVAELAQARNCAWVRQGAPR